MQDISEDVLVKASKGDLSSFEIIYNAAAGFVFNVAYRIVSNREDAQEVSQEVFINIFHSLKNFRFESSLKTWIYRVTANTAINYAKKTKKHHLGVEYTEALNLEDPNGNAHQKINQESNERIIEALLNAVNTDQRACIVLRNIEGLSYQQIAEVLKIPVNTVRSRIKRARETMLALKNEVIKNEL